MRQRQPYEYITQDDIDAGRIQPPPKSQIFTLKKIRGCSCLFLLVYYSGYMTWVVIHRINNTTVKETLFRDRTKPLEPVEEAIEWAELIKIPPKPPGPKPKRYQRDDNFMRPPLSRSLGAPVKGFVSQAELDLGFRPPKTGAVARRAPGCPGLFLLITHTGDLSWVMIHRDHIRGELIRTEYPRQPGAPLATVKEAIEWGLERKQQFSCAA